MNSGYSKMAEPLFELSMMAPIFYGGKNHEHMFQIYPYVSKLHSTGKNNITFQVVCKTPIIDYFLGRYKSMSQARESIKYLMKDAVRGNLPTISNQIGTRLCNNYIKRWWENIGDVRPIGIREIYGDSLFKILSAQPPNVLDIPKLVKDSNQSTLTPSDVVKKLSCSDPVKMLDIFEEYFDDTPTILFD